MKERLTATVITALAATFAIVALIQWIRSAPDVVVVERIPGMDATPSNIMAAVRIDIKGVFTAFKNEPSDLPGNWPNFRGPLFDNVAREAGSLSDHWGQDGPKVLWSIDLGEGHAGPAVANGRMYLLDYDEKMQGDALRCFSLADGKELWQRRYQVVVKRNHGMSRTVPAVTDKHVVTIGPKCHVMCVDAISGDFRWGIDLVADYDTEVPLWYTGQCPIIDGDTAVIAPGGSALLVGVDCATGKVLWKTPNPEGWKMSHSSVTPMTIDGQPFYVYSAIGGIAGISAGGPDMGKTLWSTTEFNNAVVAPSPVSLGDGRIFLTAGYGRGSMMIRVSRKGDHWLAESLYSLTKKTFSCEQQTPVFYKGCLFSILPKDAGSLKNQLACLRPDGKLAWTSGKTARFGLGPFLIADDKIFVLNDDGVLTMARASTESYVPLAQAKLMDGRDAWAPMVLLNGRLILRDWKTMLCIDVSKQGDNP